MTRTPAQEATSPTDMGRRSVDTLPGRWEQAESWKASERHCQQCGEAFSPKRQAQLFCPGGKCRAAYHQDRYRREAHRCPLCGREHEP